MTKWFRTLVISDIHGCYEKWIKLLKKINFNPKEDRLILLGDYLDRGDQSRQVIEETMRMVHAGEAIALRGNHDQQFIDWITTTHKYQDMKFIKHGGLQTINSYCDNKLNLLNIQNPGVLEKVKTDIRKRYKEHSISG
jgi:serine/threonine protein phosphatase 1